MYSVNLVPDPRRDSDGGAAVVLTGAAVVLTGAAVVLTGAAVGVDEQLVGLGVGAVIAGAGARQLEGLHREGEVVVVLVVDQEPKHRQLDYLRLLLRCFIYILKLAF